MTAGGLGEAVGLAALADQDVRVVQQPVDGRSGEGLGHQLVKPEGCRLLVIATERRS